MTWTVLAGTPCPPDGRVRLPPRCSRPRATGHGGGGTGMSEACPDVLALLVDRPAVRAADLGHQVQPEPALGGVPVDRRRGRPVDGGVTDIEQPEGGAGGNRRL